MKAALALDDASLRPNLAANLRLEPLDAFALRQFELQRQVAGAFERDRDGDGVALLQSPRFYGCRELVAADIADAVPGGRPWSGGSPTLTLTGWLMRSSKLPRDE